MSTDATIRSLLDEPFGPFEDVDILDEKLKSTPKNVLALKSFRMSYDDRPIGFDETEPFQPDPDTTPFTGILFRGILEIQNLTQLSARGHVWLERELREREIRRSMLKQSSTLTLEGLYSANGNIFGRRDRSLTIKVWIQGTKNMTALFLTAKHCPRGLVITSVDHNRHYEVVSMDAEIFERSRNFFRRWQSYDLLRTIIDNDEKHTPVEGRTVKYFVKEYLEQHAHRHSRHHRYIFDKDDSDVDSDGNTKLPRHPRPMHRFEILSLFAEHCEWILNDRWARKLVNREKWEAFCGRVRIQRSMSRKAGGRWGMTPGMGHSVERDGVTEEDYERKRSRSLVKEIKKVPKKSKKKVQRRVYSTESSQGQTINDDPIEELNTFGIPDYLYDEEFSEASTPSASDSEAIDDIPPDPEIIGLIHPCFRKPPTLPGVDFKWKCPVAGCPHLIDMLDLSDTTLARALNGDRTWTSIHEAVPERAFYQMVSNHWEDHLTRGGVKWVGGRKGTPAGKLEWQHPGRHRHWPPKRIKGHPKQDILQVKEEEMSADESVEIPPSRFRARR